MTTSNNETLKEPLWLAMERRIAEHASKDSSGSNLEAVMHTIASELDESGYRVSNYGGNMLRLRWALGEKNRNGRPLMQDLDAALQKLTFEDVENTRIAAAEVINAVGEAWPEMKDAERRPAILEIIEKIRLDFLIKKAKDVPEKEGIRYLIASGVSSGVITEALGISRGRYVQEVAAIEAENAEKARVQALYDAVAEKSEEERIKHLINKDVTDELIAEIAGADRATIDKVKKLMEEELKEKQRLAEEEAARKAALAAGPSLEEISIEDRLRHIESIRDIMDLSEKEDEIRKMCEQSKVPKCLVDIAISDPDRLDTLEAEA